MIVKECMAKNRRGMIEEIIKSNCEVYGKDKESRCRKSTATAGRYHKCNILKTDEWQISTSKNVSELHNVAEEKFTGEEKGNFSMHTKSSTSNKPEGTSNTENYKCYETTTNHISRGQLHPRMFTSNKNRVGKKKKVNLA